MEKQWPQESRRTSIVEYFKSQTIIESDRFRRTVVAGKTIVLFSVTDKNHADQKVSCL